MTGSTNRSGGSNLAEVNMRRLLNSGFRHAFIGGVLFLALSCVLALKAQSEAKVLKLGASVEHEIKPGVVHLYTIALRPGQYARVIVNQTKIDVPVILSAPDGKELSKLENPAGFPLAVIAETSGPYQVEVRAQEKNSAAGHYVIKLAELREATQQDRSLVAAERAYSEAQGLSSQGTVESSKKSIGKYEEALSLYRAVGNQGGEANTLTRLGRVYDGLGNKKKALDLYNQALPLHRAVNDRSGEVYTLNYIALVQNLSD